MSNPIRNDMQVQTGEITNVVMLGDSLTQSGGITTLQLLMLKHAPANIQMRHIASHDEGSMLHRLLVFSKAVLMLLWTLIWHKVDLVHVHISDGGSILRKSIIAMIAFLFRKPVVMHANGSVFHRNYAKLPHWSKRWLRQILQRCSVFLPVTTHWRDYYQNALGLDKARVLVLPNPAEMPEHVPDRRHTQSVKFAFCGRLGERKGAFDCIQAFANLPIDVQQRAELVMAGDGEIERAQQLVEQLNLTGRVKLTGWIGPEQRNRLLEQADVFVLPTNNEGLPLALIEAMCYGLPVLTTPSSGIPDVVTAGKNGVLVPPGEIQLLSEAMERLIQDEAFRLSLGCAARATAQSLDIYSFWTRLSEIYSSVLAMNQRTQRLGKPSLEAMDS